MCLQRNPCDADELAQVTSQSALVGAEGYKFGKSSKEFKRSEVQASS